VGSYQLKEQWAFAGSGETVDERFTSYHALLGVEYAVSRWIALRAEGHYAAVPDSIGVGGVSALFGETDLGGPSVRIKILAGR
jgi:opacity protein-like surface antigen